MKSPILSILSSLTFMFFMIGGVTIFAGYQSLQSAAKVTDESWEHVTLEQWLAGETENSTLFEMSNFEAGEQYWAAFERHSDNFRMVYVPLYPLGQAEDDGTRVQVVAGISNVKNEQELEVALNARPIKIQAYGDSAPLYAKNLSEAYPKLDWNSVHWVIINDNLPTSESAWITLSIGSIIASLGLVPLGLWGTFWWRRRSAKRGSFATAAARLETVDVNSEKRSELKSSFLANLWFKINPYIGYCTTALLIVNSALAYGMRAGVLDSTWVMPILLITGPTFLISATFSGIATFFSSPGLKMERLEAIALPRKVRDRLENEIAEFQLYGFKFLGFASTTFMGNKTNAFLISTDCKRIIEITDKAGKISVCALCVTSDGLVYTLSKSSADLKLNGLETGVPLIAEISKKFTAVELIAGLEEFHQTVRDNGDDLLSVSPSQIFHLMHYDAILAGWWSYNLSLRFSKPEPMPRLQELSADGVSFSFQRNGDLDDAFSFENAESITPKSTISKVETNAVEVGTCGGEELYSARFFKS